MISSVRTQLRRDPRAHFTSRVASARCVVGSGVRVSGTHNIGHVCPQLQSSVAFRQVVTSSAEYQRKSRIAGTARPRRETAKRLRFCVSAVAGESADESAKDATLGKVEDREINLEQLGAQIQEDVALQVPALMKAAVSRGTQSDQERDLELPKRVRQILAALKEGLVERETEVRLMLLAAYCGEHLLLLGPPGTAKSELGRRLAGVTKGTYFERLLTRFSVPEELFGPLSLQGLENDEYVRRTEGYLPAASVAFVDEIFKANSAILNSLLTILNERLFDNGAERVQVPLLCLVGASNELPESEELDALYDRFLFRKSVSQVSEGCLPELLRWAAASGRAPQNGAPDPEPAPELLVEDMTRVRSEALASVSVPDEVLELLADVREYLQEKCEPPVYVSDRRLVKIVAMLRVAAYTSGRSAVSEYDTLLLQHTLCSDPREAQMILDWLLDRIAQDKGSAQVDFLMKGLFRRCCQKDEHADLAFFKGVRKEVAALKETLLDQVVLLSDVSETVTGLQEKHLWIGDEEVIRIKQSLEPMMRRVRGEVEKQLADACSLDMCIEAALEQGSLEPYLLAMVMPDQWKDFIRNGPAEEVNPLGTRRI